MVLLEFDNYSGEAKEGLAQVINIHNSLGSSMLHT